MQAWSSRKENSSVSLAWFSFVAGLLEEHMDRPEEVEVCESIRTPPVEIKRGHQALGWPSLEFEDDRWDTYMERRCLSISEHTDDVLPEELGMRQVFAASFAYSEFVVLESEFDSIGEAMTDGLLHSGGGSTKDHQITAGGPWVFAIMEGQSLPFFIGVSFSERYQ